MFLCAKNVLLLELLFSDQNISIVGVSYYTTCSFHHIVRNLLLIPDTYMLTWKHFVLLVHFVLITYLLHDNKYMYINQHVFKFESFVLMSTAGKY